MRSAKYTFLCGYLFAVGGTTTLTAAGRGGRGRQLAAGGGSLIARLNEPDLAAIQISSGVCSLDTHICR